MFQPKPARTISLGNSLSNYFRPLLIFYITTILKSSITVLCSIIHLNLKQPIRHQTLSLITKLENKMSRDAPTRLSRQNKIRIEISLGGPCNAQFV